MFAFLIFAVVFLIGTCLTVARVRHLRGAEVNAAISKADKWLDFSWPAREVLSAYNSLPAENRPTYDVEAALRALDTKYGRDTVTAHHIENSTVYYGRRQNSWNCACVFDSFEYERIDADCKYQEYREMYYAVNEISSALRMREQAIKDREHQMVLAGLEHDLKAVDVITAAMRAERDLINDVTKEIAS